MNSVPKIGDHLGVVLRRPFESVVLAGVSLGDVPGFDRFVEREERIGPAARQRDHRHRVGIDCRGTELVLDNYQFEGPDARRTLHHNPTWLVSPTLAQG